jgi:hypothetical protein
MKITNLAIVLAALTTSAEFTLAQNEDVIQERIPAPPPDVLIGGGAGRSLAEERVRLAVSQDHLKEAERALASSQKAMQLAQASAGSAGFAKTLARGGNRSGSAGRVLVIPKEAGDAKSLTEVEEDMNVMGHILDKAVSGEGRSTRAMGISVFGRMVGGGGSPQNLFIEGHGAVFFEQVNYPLLPPLEKDKNADTKEKPNSEWEQARKEMTRPPGGADVFVSIGESLEREFLWAGGAPAAYDADKVGELKRDLISALKNAANIRNLKSDETVTVVVTAPGAGAGGGGKTIRNTGAKQREEELAVVELASERAAASAPAKLVLRVRKADAEAFQNGQLSLDDFTKKVTVMIY